MNENLTDVENLALIDQQCALNPVVDKNHLSLAQYDLIRRVIQQTGDWEYQFLLRFGKHSLSVGAEVLAAKNPVVVDVSIIQTGITPYLEKTFVNPVYCAQSLVFRRQKHKSYLATSLDNLAQTYPDAVFVIGQDSECLNTILELTKARIIFPPLIIATAPSFRDEEVVKKHLDNLVDLIWIDGNKGNSIVAIAIFNALLALAWQVYEQNEYNLGYIEHFEQKNPNSSDLIP